MRKQHETNREGRKNVGKRQAEIEERTNKGSERRPASKPKDHDRDDDFEKTNERRELDRS